MIDPEMYTHLIRSAMVGLVGLVFWFARLVYVEVKKMQKHRYRSEVVDDKVQSQLKALQETQNQLKQDINLILNLVLNSGSIKKKEEG